jgi:hypothetical protein
MWWFVAPGEIFFAWWLSMCVDDFMLFQMMVRPTYHTIHLSTSCIVMMHVGRDRVGFSFCCSFPQDRDGFREEVSFRGEVGRKSKSVVRSIVDSSVNYTAYTLKVPTTTKFFRIPCTTSSIFTAPHGYLVGKRPIFRTGPITNLPLF